MPDFTSRVDLGEPAPTETRPPAGPMVQLKRQIAGLSFQDQQAIVAPPEAAHAPQSSAVQLMADTPVQRADGEPTAEQLTAEIVAAVKTDYKNSPIRVAYEGEVKGLEAKANGLLADKDTSKDDTLEPVARELNKDRLDIGKKYKDLTILPLRDYIYFANSQRYDTPFGPSYEYLKNVKGKNNLQIIQGSYRPNPDINAFLAPFESWLGQQPLAKLKEYKTAVKGSGG